MTELRVFAQQWGLDCFPMDIGKDKLWEWLGTRARYPSEVFPESFGSGFLPSGVPASLPFLPGPVTSEELRTLPDGTALRLQRRSREPVVSICQQWHIGTGTLHEAEERIIADVRALLREQLATITEDATAEGYEFRRPRPMHERDLDWLWQRVALRRSCANIARSCHMDEPAVRDATDRIANLYRVDIPRSRRAP